MSTQYDNIGISYDGMKKLPVAPIEAVNVKEATKPYISGARVLDLACGTGHFSNMFSDWGASSILGIDISTAMIDAARASSKSDKTSFEVADCSKPVKYDGGPFDLVFGAWFLNYASSGTEMAGMFRNAWINLKEAGHFVAVTPPPTNDPRGNIEAMQAARPAWYGGVTTTMTGEVEDGISTHLDTHLVPKVEFDNYHLRKDVYEIAAREGGFEGGLSWREITIPEGYGDSIGRKEDVDWKSYSKLPHCGILVVCKG
jgi:SAM-dependent methyltransferase